MKHQVIDNFQIPKWDFLSNFYPSIIRIPSAEWQYPTVEHYYQAQKTKRLTQLHRDIMTAQTPGEAKKLGRKADIPKNWELLKVGIMLAGLRYKFRDERMQHRLDQTGDAILVEGNTWGDRFWGMTRAPDGSSGAEFMEGLNMLGVLLMIVRQEHRMGFRVQIPGDD
jgi:ribA/ribD-fused uncharacterized protein